MLVGQDTLRSGGVWALGDGKTIRPFVDPWLSGRYAQRLGLHPITQAQASCRLEDWIDHDAKAWKESIVRAALSREEAKAVLQITVPRDHRGDQLIWPFEKDGLVTVRSAYHYV